MLKKTITYTDYNDVQRTEDFYFNLSRAEIGELELSVNGGMTALISKIMNETDTAELMTLWKKVIMLAYGEKSIDGKRFIKSEELSTAFTQTEAYSELFMELMTVDGAAAKFMNAIIPNVPQDHLPKKEESNVAVITPYVEEKKND